MYISFQWTVELMAMGGEGVTVAAVHTELREANYAGVLQVTTGPDAFDKRLLPGMRLAIPQGTSGLFDSSLYPGQWQGMTSVEITHSDGRTETQRLNYSFR